jgi:hypothetical protein
VGNADQHVLLDTPFMRLKTAVTTAWWPSNRRQHRVLCGLSTTNQSSC